MKRNLSITLILALCAMLFDIPQAFADQPLFFYQEEFSGLTAGEISNDQLRQALGDEWSLLPAVQSVPGVDDGHVEAVTADSGDGLPAGAEGGALRFTRDVADEYRWSEVGAEYTFPQPIIEGRVTIEAKMAFYWKVNDVWRAPFGGIDVWGEQDGSKTRLGRLNTNSSRALLTQLTPANEDTEIGGTDTVKTNAWYTMRYIYDLDRGVYDIEVEYERAEGALPITSSDFETVTNGNIHTIRSKMSYPIAGDAAASYSLTSFRVLIYGYATHMYVDSIKVQQEDTTARLVQVTDAADNVLENGGDISTTAAGIKLQFSNALDADTVSNLEVLKDAAPVPVTSALSEDGTICTVSFDELPLDEGTYTVSLDGVLGANQKPAEMNAVFSFEAITPPAPEIASIQTDTGMNVSGRLPQSTASIVVEFNTAMDPDCLTDTNIRLLYGGQAIAYQSEISGGDTRYTLSWDGVLPEGEYQLVLSGLRDAAGTEMSEEVRSFSIAKNKVEINEVFSNYTLGLDMADAKTNGWEYHKGENGGTVSIVNNATAALTVMGIGPINETDSASVTIPFPEQTARFEIEYSMLCTDNGGQPYVELYGGGEKVMRLATAGRVFRILTDLNRGDADASALMLFGTGSGDFKFGGRVPVTIKFSVDMVSRTFDLTISHSSLVGYSGAFNADAGVMVDTAAGVATIQDVPLLGEARGIDAVKFGAVWTTVPNEMPVIGISQLKINSVSAIDAVYTDFGGAVQDGDTISVRNTAFELAFSDAPDLQSLEGIRLTTADGGTEIPLTGSVVGDRRYRVSFGALEPQTAYVLHLEGITDAGGKPIVNRTTVPFVTGGAALRAENETFSTDEIGTNETITASATIINENNEPKQAVMLVFQYSADGIVKRVMASRAQAAKAEVRDGVLVPGTARLETSIPLKDKSDGDIVAVYTWENITGGAVISEPRILR